MRGSKAASENGYRYSSRTRDVIRVLAASDEELDEQLSLG